MTLITQPAQKIVESPALADALLRRALYSANFKLARDALNQGASVNKAWGGTTHAIVASFTGDERALDFLLNFGCDLLVLDPTGKTALHLASYRGHVGCIQRLLDAAPQAALISDQNGYTPLMQAAKYGNLACAQLLMPHSCTDTLDVNGRNALAWAALQGHTQLAELLIPCTSDGHWTQLLVHHPGGPRTLDMFRAHHERACIESSTPLATPGRGSLRV